MRVTHPAVTIKAIWDALTAEYGIAGSYGLLLETNLDAKVSLAKADLTTLEARLSAIRAGYLDNLSAGAVAQASAYTAARAAALEDLGRALEGYTPTIAAVNNNGATYVTVLDITGRGILTSGSATWYEDLGFRSLTMKVTIDGGVVFEDVIGESRAGVVNPGFVIFNLGFDTDCKLEMKANGTLTSGKYTGVAQVE